MDIVYILGKGSVWENNEIRYSLRSVFKNVLDLDNVFIIGERPEWLKNIYHIVAKDPYPVKWKNAYHKISIACNSKKISSDFLLMNDDFFITKEIQAKNYPYYYNRFLRSKIKTHTKRFLTSRENTAEKLEFLEKDFLNFCVHRPFIYNKEKFKNLPKISFKILGFSVRSFYANYYNVPAIKSKDPLLSPLKSKKDFDKLTRNLTDFSIFSATARSPIFRNWIRDKFPEPSPFE